MRKRVVLDPYSENKAEADLLEVTNEVNFLKNVNSSQGLFIKGRFLCGWASELGIARRWEVNWRTAPSSELRQACPSLSEGEARKFISRFWDLECVTRPISLADLAIRRWPEIDSEGKSEPDLAWSWLLWRCKVELEPDESIVVASVATSYSLQASPAITAVFAVRDAAEGWRKMKEWLRCESSDLEFPPHPKELPPSVLAHLEGEWRLKAIQTRGSFFGDLVNFGASQLILKRAAVVLLAYCQKNPEHLTPERLALVKPFVGFREWIVLRDLLPPSDPGSAPTTLPELFAWFSNEYLPYRLRSSRAAEYPKRVREIGRDFGLWYLKFYSNARTGGDGRELMSWSKTAQLAQETAYVKLLIVLDGLGYVDGKQITEFILSECPRLALDDTEVLLAPLPTVTHFAKPALMAGVSPVIAFEEKEIGSIETRDPDVIRALNQSAPADVVIWSILEPDKTYHKPIEAQTLAYEVEGRLRSIAKRIARIVNEVEDTQKLRVLITTDHGRLLSSSRRIHPIPKNMQAHGRAAWGLSSAPFDSDGIHVEDEIAFIDPGRFGLPEAASIVISDDAFLTSDGRTGVESFAHGGVFPEEVLIPWIQLTRDRQPLRLTLNLTGSGMAGAAGKMRLQVSNTSDVRVEILQVQLSFSDTPLNTNVSVAPFAGSTIEWTIANWPQKSDLPTLQAAVLCAVPSGEREVFRTTPEFTVEEMYSRETILDDLL